MVQLVNTDLMHSDPEWDQILASGCATGSSGVLASIFSPLLTARPIDQPLVIGQIGQSLDGRVATANGDSRDINSVKGLLHLHRLRALVDVVVIGVDTAIADNPKLTVRLVKGASPARAVIDRQGRLSADARVFDEDGIRRFIIDCGNHLAQPGVEQISLPACEGRIAPRAMVDALAARGFQRILIEGGPKTIAAFIEAGCLDRLHVIVAPILIGSGRQGIDLPPIDRLSQCLRPPTRVFPLGDGETLFDMDLREFNEGSE